MVRSFETIPQRCLLPLNRQRSAWLIQMIDQTSRVRMQTKQRFESGEIALADGPIRFHAVDDRQVPWMKSLALVL